MAHRITFWKPKNGVDVWIPASWPLGEQIRTELRSGQESDRLIAFDTHVFLERLRSLFPNSRESAEGTLSWQDDDSNGFVAKIGVQHVEVSCFGLADEHVERVFEVAERLGCDHYDWGN